MPIGDDFEGGGGGGGGGGVVPPPPTIHEYAPTFNLQGAVTATEQAPVDLTPNGVSYSGGLTTRTDYLPNGSITLTYLPAPPVNGFSFSTLSGGGSDQLSLMFTGGDGLAVSGQQIYQYGSVIGTWSGGFGASPLSVTFSGGGAAASLAAQVMDAVRYLNTSDAPSGSVVLQFTFETHTQDPAQQPPTSYQPVVVNLVGVNDAPTLSHPLADQSATAGGAFNFAFPGDTFADPDRPGASAATLGLGYTATLANGQALPSWLHFNGTSFFGTPTNADAGTVQVKVVAADDGGLAVSDAFALTVTATNTAPIVNGPLAISTPENSNGGPIDAFTGASDPDAGTTLVVVNVAAPLPPGVSYSAATHSFILDPSNPVYNSLAAGQSAVVTVNYGISDGTATTAQSLVWTIVGSNDAPVVSAPLIRAATEGGAVSSVDALSNAQDPDSGATLSVLSGALPAGVTYDAASKTFSLDPTDAAYQHLTAGQSIVVTANYGVTDGTLTTPDAIKWTITGTNDAPVVSGAVAGVATEDGPAKTLNALANAGDVDDATTLSVANVPASLPAGVTYDAANHAFTLDPANAAYQHLAAGETTIVSVSYGVSDGMATTAASASWTVTGTNDAPMAVADTAAGTENQALTIDVLANDTDADDGASRTLVSVTAPAGKGLATVVDGKVAFDPGAAFDHLAAGATETVTLNYAMKDDQGAASASTVTVTITGTNDAPVVTGAVTGAASEDAASSTLSGLANASDVDTGAVLSVVNVGALPAGVSYDAAAGTFTLDPANAAFQGLAASQTTTVSVGYGVSDGTVTTPASVSWTVTGTNDAPVVTAAVTGAAAEDAAASTLKALANASDVDTGAVLNVVDVAALPAGVTYDSTAQAFTLNAGAEAYQHLAAGETTTVSVSYGVSDGTATTAASVSWTVTGTNDAPVVSGAVTGAASEDGAASTLDALVNASDVDTGAVLSVVDIAALPAGVSYDAGAASFTLSPGVAAYQHLAAGETTTVSVSYGVSDGTVTTPASLSWTVTGTNDAPVVSGAVTGAASEDGAASTLDARAHASDVDTGAVLSVVDVPALPAGVTYDAAAQAFTLNAGAAAYQHLGLGQTALVSVAYGVSDGTVTTSASVAWTVTGTNDGPVAVHDTGAVNEDASVTLNVLANDTDVDDGDSKTITAVGATALGGHVTIVGGQLVYAADADLFDHLTPGQTLTDSFTYTMKDAAGLTSAATATITVAGVADGASLIGGNKTQVLTGTTLDEHIAGGNADDTLYGNDGADELHGNNGKDLLYGGQGQDKLFGENGADVLDGGIGNDTLTGGAGPDAFVFGANFGADVVTDFDNTDTLKFVGGYTTAAQVLSHASQQGADVLITSGADSILLKGVALSSLSAGDFLFG